MMNPMCQQKPATLIGFAAGNLSNSIFKNSLICVPTLENLSFELVPGLQYVSSHVPSIRNPIQEAALKDQVC